MEKLVLLLDNIKCDGCVNNIQKAMTHHSNIHSVEVNKASAQVLIEGTDLSRNELIDELASLGYPEKASKSIFSKLMSGFKK